MCVSCIMLKYIVLVDQCAVSASPGGTLHMSICVISACKSVSLCTPALYVESSACVGCLHLFNL